MLMGLAANRLHHQSEDAALFAFLRACEAGIRELRLGLHAVGRTHDAIAAAGMLRGYAPLVRYPYGREGGLMKLVAEVVGMPEPGRTLDGAIYLIDPVDPSSIFPEALALKRQCVIHGKPFLSTVASARDWVEMERIHSGLPPDRHADRFHDYEAQTLALIAHDAMKGAMLDFAARNFDLFSRFGCRVGTGTTGQRLNEMAWSRGWPAGEPWVQRFNSGPLGGDAQIADLVLERRCRRAIFFEDPHVARQHEADIQLLERAVTTATHDAVCTTSPVVAQRWCDAARLRGSRAGR
ncbi:methylglyoxal synthase [Alicycliphilus denitrificans]|uniref:methylglyoxal synthase n=1 Tax=Alicycliphilus denitrificans TaxID=179636 RepID=UPI000C9EE3D8|nr:methylglyoxal synthase [Alicycliphilus denitrificans]